MEHKVPPEARWLIAEYLPSIEHIDVLLFLARQGEIPTSLEDIARGISLHSDLVRKRLDDLVACNLVSNDAVSAGGAPAYSARSPNPRVAHALAVLQQTYTTKPVSLIRYIYERPADAAQRFADAFRLRKDRE